MKYAILNEDRTIREIREFDALPRHKAGRVLIIEETPVSFNPETQTVTPHYNVEADKVTLTYSVSDIVLPIPQEVSNQQLRLALIEKGIMPSQIMTLITSMPDGADKEKALAAWEYANHFRRTHPLVLTMAAALSLTSEQVDDIFALANTL